MKAKRLLEICLALTSIKYGQKTKYCRSLKGELGLTSKDIISTEVNYLSDDEEESQTLCRKTVKAVFNKVRNLICEIASEKGIVSIGGPIPKVGGWNTEKKIIKFSPLGRFVILRDESAGSKMTTFYDPLDNPDFIKLLLAEET